MKQRKKIRAEQTDKSQAKQTTKGTKVRKREKSEQKEKGDIEHKLKKDRKMQKTGGGLIIQTEKRSKQKVMLMRKRLEKKRKIKNGCFHQDR